MPLRWLIRLVLVICCFMERSEACSLRRVRVRGPCDDRLTAAGYRSRGMGLINKAKREKRPYDTQYEAKIKDAQARASKVATAVPTEGAR